MWLLTLDERGQDDEVFKGIITMLENGKASGSPSVVHSMFQAVCIRGLTVNIQTGRNGFGPVGSTSLAGLRKNVCIS